MPKNVLTEKRFQSPFTPSYWKSAFLEFRNIKTLCVVAMMLAASVLIDSYLRIPIPIMTNLNIMFGFLPNAIAAAVGGPVMSIAYGVLADIISYLMNPWGAYFPGYTLSAALVMLTFSLFFYRRKISVWRILVSKFIYNGFINILLGAFWTSCLYEKGYVVYLWTSFLKNAILYPIEVAMLLVVFGAMIPPMVSLHLIPAQKTIVIGWIQKVSGKNKEKLFDD